MHLITKIYTQEPHPSAEHGVIARLKLRLVDAGGGEYLVLSANEWAIEVYGDIERLSTEMKKMLRNAKPHWTDRADVK